MPFKLPKNAPLDKDIEDRRDEVQDPANDRSRTITNIYREYDRYRALGSHRTISREDYMKNLSKARTQGLEEDMHGEATRQMTAQAEHDKARAKRRASASKKFPGVK